MKPIFTTIDEPRVDGIGDIYIVINYRKDRGGNDDDRN
jgi:hypothetical protein